LWFGDVICGLLCKQPHSSIYLDTLLTAKDPRNNNNARFRIDLIPASFNPTPKDPHNQFLEMDYAWIQAKHMIHVAAYSMILS
jgi:hypothetical protein